MRESEDRTETYPDSRLLSNALLRKREAQAFPPEPSEKWARAPSPANSLPRHCSQGIPEGCGGRKLISIIDAREGRVQLFAGHLLAQELVELLHLAGPEESFRDDIHDLI